MLWSLFASFSLFVPVWLRVSCVRVYVPCTLLSLTCSHCYPHSHHSPFPLALAFVSADRLLCPPRRVQPSGESTRRHLFSPCRFASRVVVSRVGDGGATFVSQCASYVCPLCVLLLMLVDRGCWRYDAHNCPSYLPLLTSPPHPPSNASWRVCFHLLNLCCDLSTGVFARAVEEGGTHVFCSASLRYLLLRFPRHMNIECVSKTLSVVVIASGGGVDRSGRGSCPCRWH